MKLYSAIVTAITLMVLVTIGSGVAYGLTWEMGLKAGVTNSRLTGDPVTIWLGEGDVELMGAVDDYKVGFIGGAYARVDFNNFFGIQAEILYAQKGGKGPSKGTAVVTPPNRDPLKSTFEGTLTLQADYIEVPVLAVFSVKSGESGRLSLRGLIGPTFSYNTSAKMRLEGEAFNATLPLDEQWITVDESKDAGTQVVDFELGALMGISISYAFKGMEMLLDVRLGHGLTTIDNTANARSTYNSGVDLMAGVAIPFGSR